MLLVLLIINEGYAMEITSSAFANNTLIPSKYTCDGENVSPPLAWQDVPEGTESFKLIVDDPDAPSGTWTHWVLYDIPADVKALPEDIKQLPAGTKVGPNSWQKNEYGGPCPPSGQHHYHFKLYALDKNSHILAKAELIGLYR
jgi:Raf kinase inhibitor-like YbhB/YbcL family protein